MGLELPSPFVYWAQDATSIFLKVDLKDAKDQHILLDTTSIFLSAYGVGAQGSNKYAFSLDFFENIDADDEVHTCKVSPRALEICLKKTGNAWWPRLIKHQQKPAWLKIDFERWKTEDEDASEGENDNNENSSRDVIGDYPELYEQLKKDEIGYVKEDVKKVYLIFYNLAQFVFFMYILVVMGIRYARDGQGSMSGTYEAVGPVIKFAQLIQFLEVLHPLFGYTKGSPITPFIQVTGRSIILFAMIESEPRMQTKPVVFYLFLVWASIEVVRYPYYILSLYHKNIEFLTWLRYTLWIPLYPSGVLCEGIIILRNIPYFEETGRFIVEMPNAWNVTFHTPTLMRVYLMALILPGLYTMMNHMYRVRVKKLGPKTWKKKTQ